MEVEAPAVDEFGATIELTDNLIEVLNTYEIEIPPGIDVTVAGVDGQLTIVDFEKNCAVQIPGMGSIYFLTECPTEPDGLEIELGAWIDIPSNVHAWPEGVKAPEQVLCRSKEDPKHYKLYKYRREIEGTEYEDTSLLFGGTFTAESWERFHKIMASFKQLDLVITEEGR